MSGVESVNAEMLKESAVAVAEAEKALKVKTDLKLEELRHRLEIETHKLEDCQREIENYRSHFEENTVMVGPYRIAMDRSSCRWPLSFASTLSMLTIIEEAANLLKSFFTFGQCTKNDSLDARCLLYVNVLSSPAFP